MSDILEMVMVICFGASWPINIYKLWKVRSTKGSSVFFYSLVAAGYVAGIISKAIKAQEGITTPAYVWFFYILNACMVSCGIAIWIRNRILEKKSAES